MRIERPYVLYNYDTGDWENWDDPGRTVGDRPPITEAQARHYCPPGQMRDFHHFIEMGDSPWLALLLCLQADGR